MSFKELMFNLLTEGKNEQAFVDHAAKHFHSPIWIMDQSFQILEYSRNPSAEELRSYVELHKEEQLMLWQQDDQMKRLGNADEIICHYNALLQCYVTCGNICIPNGERHYLAVFSEDEANVPSSDDVKDLLDALVLCAGRAKVFVENSYGSSALLGLLEGKLPEELYQAKEILHKLKQGNYLMFLRRNTVEKRADYKGYYCSRLSQKLPGGLCAIWHNAVVVLCPNVNETIRILREIVRDDQDILIGISRQFFDLDHVSDYAAQAEMALRYAALRKEPVLQYDQISAIGIADVLEQHQKLAPFCRSEVLQAALYDKANHTEHIDTLRALLEAKGNRKEAGAILGIHTNTMKYRIARLRELFGIDINDYEFMSELPLSLEILSRI